MLSLQHDVGKWCTEYTWSADDGMWGVRVLHNFGKLGVSPDTSSVDDSSQSSRNKTRVKRVDEEEAIGGGLKGRFSAGAEFYFSAKEKSAGGENSSVTHKQTMVYILRSIYRCSFYNDSGRDATIIPASSENIVSAFLGINTRATFASHHYYCII